MSDILILFACHAWLHTARSFSSCGPLFLTHFSPLFLCHRDDDRDVVCRIIMRRWNASAEKKKNPKTLNNVSAGYAHIQMNCDYANMNVDFVVKVSSGKTCTYTSVKQQALVFSSVVINTTCCKEHMCGLWGLDNNIQFAGFLENCWNYTKQSPQQPAAHIVNNVEPYGGESWGFQRQSSK